MKARHREVFVVVAFLEFRPVGNVRENFGGSAVMTVRLH